MQTVTGKVGVGICVPRQPDGLACTHFSNIAEEKAYGEEQQWAFIKYPSAMVNAGNRQQSLCPNEKRGSLRQKK
jgi:hypothetical protein